MSEVNDDYLAKQWANYAYKTKYEDIPKPVIDYSKWLILDILGCIIGAHDLESSRVAAKVMSQLGGKPESTVIGYNSKNSAMYAAFVNAATGHAFDMDDDHREGTLHSSVVVFPATLAIGETLGTSGKDFLTAFALGSELMIRLGESFLGKSYWQGFHPTGTTGVFGSALAAGKLMGLEPDNLAWAQGIAGSEPAGNQEYKHEGTMTKRFQAGYASMSGILAALLARDGYTGPGSIYEGVDGFCHAYSYRDTYDTNRIVNKLGEKWELLDNSIKPHACCRFSCPICDCSIEIGKKYAPKPEDIQDILVKCNQWMITMLTEPTERKYNPVTEVDAQFNLPYATAVGIIKKRASVPEFTEEAIRDPEVHALMQKVKFELDPESEKVYPKKYPATMIVTMKDGTQYKSYVEYPLGDPENPVSREQLLDKFRLLASMNISAERAERVIEMVDNLEKLGNINELGGILR